MSLSSYIGWITNEALPFWVERGRNRNTGLFHERLMLDGSPDSTADLRVRTHLRQVYVLAHAAALGLPAGKEGLRVASDSIERLRGLAWGVGGRPGWAHRLTCDGEVVDARRDLYDHAFALLALGWLYKATGETEYLRWIDETLTTIDVQMAAASGGWAESDRHELPRRQNPHMHLFEACLGLYETTGEKRYLMRAGEVFGLFRTRFFDDRDGVVLEFFDEDWRLSAQRGNRLDPGHMMEWVWLLRRYERMAGRPVDGMCARLFASGERLGRNDATGFLIDEVDRGGRVLTAGSRLWLQTEYLKALIEQAHRLGNREMQAAEDFCERLTVAYLRPAAPGCWIDRLDLAGRPVAEHVPASTLYHLFAAAVVALERSTSTAAPDPA